VRELVSPIWVIAVAALIVVGIVLLVVSGGDGTVGVIGFGLLGLGAVVGTAVAFYAVGRSEDIARERGRD
jgi:drug/metabolite transporter (DMT)-like permease